MALFGLLKTVQQRELESKVRFRQGRHRIQKFIQQLQKNADQYYSLARQAYCLGDDGQFRQLAGGYVQKRESVTRWERYLLKLDTLEMRRGEVEATSDFLGSMNSLTRSILNGASIEDINRMQADLAQAIEMSEAQEEVLSMVMDATSAQLDVTESLDDRLLDQLTADIKRPSDTNSTRSVSTDDAELDERIELAVRELQNAESR